MHTAYGRKKYDKDVHSTSVIGGLQPGLGGTMDAHWGRDRPSRECVQKDQSNDV
jgi:hypothetical protein